MAKVVVFGNGQSALMTHSYLTHDSPHEVVGFAVDERMIDARTLVGLPVVPFESVESDFPPTRFAMTVQASHRRLNRLRAEKYEQAKGKGYELITFVSSRASVSPDARVGDNCFLFEGCIVQAFAVLGNDIFMAPGGVISHHAVIGDHCFLAPNAVVLGNVTVGPYCFLGASSTLKEKVAVAADCVIGAGAFVQKDTPARAVYISQPAELLPKTSDQLGNWLAWSPR